jgi:arsenate reductase
MPDPAAVKGSDVEIALAFADTYRMLNNRITAFANLKLSGLDRLSLQTKVREIGSHAITIYHNPACGTSRNTLAMIRNSGVEPTVIEYLKTPPTREILADLIRRMKIPVRALLREKGTPYQELGLSDPKVSDEQLLDAMIAHPVLINRPIVVTPLGVKLCRPSETVLDILPNLQRGAFTKKTAKNSWTSMAAGWGRHDRIRTRPRHGGRIPRHVAVARHRGRFRHHGGTAGRRE